MEDLKKNTLNKNIFWLTISELFGSLFIFISTILLTKYLGAEDFGKLGFTISFTAILGIIVDFGFNPLTIREVAKDPSRANLFIFNILSLRILLSIFFLLICVGAILLLRNDPVIVILVGLSGLTVVFQNIYHSFNAFFRGKELMHYEAISRIIFTATMLILVVGLTSLKGSLITIGSLYSVAALVTLLSVIAIFWIYFSKPRFSWNFSFWKYLIKESWPFAVSLIFISIFFHLDTVMLGILKKGVAVGWYIADYKIIFFILTFSAVLANAFFPVVARLHKNNQEAFRELLIRYSRFSNMLAIPIGLGGLILGPPLIILIFGQSYSGGSVAFQILIWSVAIIFSGMIYGNSLQACHFQKTFLKGVGFGAVINILLNLLLIPKFSINGAAIATVISEFITLLYMMFQFHKNILPLSRVFFSFKPLLAGGFMAIILFLFNNSNVIFLVILGMFSYGAALWVMSEISIKEIRILLKSVFDPPKL